jgi:hypothetical protein
MSARSSPSSSAALLLSVSISREPFEVAAGFSSGFAVVR